MKVVGCPPLPLADVYMLLDVLLHENAAMPVAPLVTAEVVVAAVAVAPLARDVAALVGVLALRDPVACPTPMPAPKPTRRAIVAEMAAMTARLRFRRLLLLPLPVKATALSVSRPEISIVLFSALSGCTWYAFE
jgi:hypothetical protein